MTNKTNFDKLAKLPMLQKPPRLEESRSPVAGYGPVRAADGRTARGTRRTGRNVQFATVVTEEFKLWIKVTAAKLGKTQAALLDDMKAAYIKNIEEIESHAVSVKAKVKG